MKRRKKTEEPQTSNNAGSLFRILSHRNVIGIALKFWSVFVDI